MHYEFHCIKNSGVDIAFHIESDEYKELQNTLEIFDNEQIGTYVIKFDQNWNKGAREEGLGQIYIQFGHEYSSEDVAKTMRMFIDETYEKIEKSIKKIQDEKK